MPPAPTVAFRQFATIARALAATAGVAAMRRAIPLFAGIGIAAAVVFGPNGMSPADLVEATHATALGRIALIAVWLLVTVPIARALIETPTTYFLRALPVPRWQFWLAHAGFLVPLQSPWIALWHGARGVSAAVCATVPVMALQLAFVARPRGWRLALAIALTVALAMNAPATVLLLVGAVTLPVMLIEAWVRAPERGAARHRSFVTRRSALLALATTYLACVRRTELPAFSRAALVTITGGLAFALAARNNRVTDASALEALSLAIATLPLAITCGSFAAPLLEIERKLRWLLDATATRGYVRKISGAGVCALLGAMFGAVHGSIAAIGTSGSASMRLRLAALATGWGATIGLYAHYSARKAERSDGVDGSSVVVRMTLAALAGVAAMVFDHALAVLASAVLMAGLIAITDAQPRLHGAR